MAKYSENGNAVISLFSQGKTEIKSFYKDDEVTGQEKARQFLINNGYAPTDRFGIGWCKGPNMSASLCDMA